MSVRRAVLARLAWLIAAVMAALLVVASLGLDAAAPARADAGGGSLAYLLGGNVWVSALDGTSARQLTTDGSAGDPYVTVSQDNAGVVYAVRHQTMSVLRHDGQAVHAPISLGTDNEGWVSPGGDLLATTFVEPGGVGLTTSTDFSNLVTGAEVNQGFEMSNPVWASESTATGVQALDAVYQRPMVDDRPVSEPIGLTDAHGYYLDDNVYASSSDGSVTLQLGQENDVSVVALVDRSGFGAAGTAVCQLTFPASPGRRAAVSPDGTQAWFDTGYGIMHLALQPVGSHDACTAVSASSAYVVQGGSGVAYGSAGIDVEAPLPVPTPTPVPPTPVPPTPVPPTPVPPVHHAPAPVAKLAGKGTVLAVTLPAKYHGRKVVAELRLPHHKWAKIATLKLSSKATASLKLTKAWRGKIKRKSVVRFLYGKKAVVTLTVK
jgi:hypothetical protein